jgi:CMP-N,N'-diacetyllegionaminic acid synthase
MAVALLGLRSGSKGIANKNIKPLHGKPLFYWVLSTIFKSSFFSSVVVSSDSSIYLDLVRTYFPQSILRLRPPSIATDESSEYEYILDAVNWCEANSLYSLDDPIFCRFHATSPFQTCDDIERTIMKLRNHPIADSSVLLRPAPIHPEKTVLIRSVNSIDVAVGAVGKNCQSVTPTNRQQLQTYYVRSNIICFRRSTIDAGTLTGEVCLPVVTRSRCHVDIDDELDFKFAEFLMSSPID